MAAKYFISGIGTGIGKTIISALLTEALEADYWKPVQAGSLENTDSDVVRSLVSNERTVIHPEAFRLQMPASPHRAAATEGIHIEVAGIRLPETGNTLVVEGAGGLMVPLNDRQLITDLIVHLNIPVILVSSHYLGSLNHTLLSLEMLRKNNIPTAGIIFSGRPDPESVRIIKRFSDVPVLAEVNLLEPLNKKNLKDEASRFRSQLKTII